MTNDLNGNVVWITGGARGLGRALVIGFANLGADVAFSYHRSETEAKRLESELTAQGVRCLAQKADLRRTDEIARIARELDTTFGRIDVLVNNAGVFERARLDELTEAHVDEALSVNLKATLFMSREAARRMTERGKGCIINVASVGGFVPWAAYTAYCASKAAVLMATKSMALALAPAVRVNAIAPGILTVPEHVGPGEGEALKKRIPLGEFGRYDDVVDAALFLATKGRYITGETLVVDGGRQLT